MSSGQDRRAPGLVIAVCCLCPRDGPSDVWLARPGHPTACRPSKGNLTHELCRGAALGAELFPVLVGGVW